jgi:hypothetical protein
MGVYGSLWGGAVVGDNRWFGKILMAATLSKHCPSCGSSHELLLLVGNMADITKQYEYTCPKSGSSVSLALIDSDWWQTIEARSAGAVVVREVGK